jgi:hypothetical protein
MQTLDELDLARMVNGGVAGNAEHQIEPRGLLQ